MGAVAWGLWPSPRFPTPLIKPDVPISGIRLSDWLHRRLTNESSLRRNYCPGRCSFFSLRYSLIGSYRILLGVADSSSITAPSLLHKHTRSKGPFLRRHYPASSVVWPSPPPRLAAALSGDV